MFESLNLCMPEVLLTQGQGHAPESWCSASESIKSFAGGLGIRCTPLFPTRARFHLLLSQLETQLRNSATSRHKRYVSGSSVCTDFIAPSSPIYPTNRHGAASEGGYWARAHPTGPFTYNPRGRGNPSCRPSPGLTEGGMEPKVWPQEGPAPMDGALARPTGVPALRVSHS